MARGFRPAGMDMGWPEPQAWGEVFQVSYGHETGWALVAEYQAGSSSVWIVVAVPISYRVHDERELVHYWNQRGAEQAPIAIAYEIAESAYLDELRNGISWAMETPLRHFLICGSGACLELLASEPPVVCREQPTIQDGRLFLAT